MLDVACALGMFLEISCGPFSTTCAAYLDLASLPSIVRRDISTRSRGRQ